MPRFFPLLLVLLLLLPATPTNAQRDDAIRFEPTPELTIFRSGHYLIHTNLTRQEVLPYGLHMDALYAQYERRFRGMGTPQIEPMALYLFRTEQQYNRFLAENDIDATHSGGMFFVTHQVQGLATWVQRSTRRRTFEVLQHEGFHQFAWHTIGPSLPVWLNEGLAQYFENGILHNGQMTLGLASGSRIHAVRGAIATGDAMSMIAMMRITNDQWAQTLRRNPERASIMYAQAWSVVYFLINGEGGVHKPKLIEYLQRLSEGERADDALLMAFGDGGLHTLAGDWRAYALRQQSDEVAIASERLAFLATGLRVLAEQGETMPQEINDLQATLQRYGFRIRRNEMGMIQDLSADQDELFQFTRNSGTERGFVLLAPQRDGLPPRITAPGLSPQPTLIWYRDADGELVQDIAYR